MLVLYQLMCRLIFLKGAICKSDEKGAIILRIQITIVLVIIFSRYWSKSIIRI
jgi:hypothetical protein